MSRWEPHIDLMRLLEALATEIVAATDLEVLQACAENGWPMARVKLLWSAWPELQVEGGSSMGRKAPPAATAGRKAGLSVLKKWIYSAPPVPVPVEFKTNTEIRVGADISASGVVYVVLARGVAVTFRGRQCARSGSEHESQR